MAGSIKVIIDQNGALVVDMSNFKSCSDKTMQLMQQLDVEADNIKLKEEEVETVTVNHQHVHRK